MSILTTIENRTENWKTAREFAPLFRDCNLRLELAKKLGEPNGTQPDQVRLELFWKGMRDYLHTTKQKREDNTQDFAQRYERLFHDLRKEIEEFQPEKGSKLRLPNERNYDISTEKGKSKLSYNLERTEIDVVLESPSYLFIGEAKDEMGFSANGDLVLVHQLIRQYVMAKILVKRLGSKKTIVPFVVRNEPKGREQVQVDFMVNKKCWLKKENILTWDCIKALTRNP